MSTENKPSKAAMRAAENIRAECKRQTARDGFLPSYEDIARLIDAELASESLEQRAKVAAEEIEGNMIPIRSGQSNVVRAQKIILRHFSGLGGGNERKELIEALKLIDINIEKGLPGTARLIALDALKASGETA